jgi:hypothetical protein
MSDETIRCECGRTFGTSHASVGGSVATTDSVYAYSRQQLAARLNLASMGVS